MYTGHWLDADFLHQQGHTLWRMRGDGFLDDEKPADTANPSLWHQARLNRIHGLLEVTPRMFQVLGFDVANITFIEGDMI